MKHGSVKKQDAEIAKYNKKLHICLFVWLTSVDSESCSLSKTSREFV